MSILKNFGSALSDLAQAFAEAAADNEKEKVEFAEKCAPKSEDYKDKLKYELFQLKLELEEYRARGEVFTEKGSALKGKIRLYEDEIRRWK